MTSDPKGPIVVAPYYAKPLFRLVTMAFGSLLAGIGIYVLVISRDHWGAVALGLVLLVLGTEAIVAGGRGKLSLLARIGPLP